MNGDEIGREEFFAMVEKGRGTVFTRGENVSGYTDDPPEVDLSGYICEVCGRPFTEHDPEQARRGVGRRAHFPGQPWEGVRCPPEDAPAS